MHKNRRTWLVYGTIVTISLAAVIYVQVQSMRRSAHSPASVELSPQEELLKAVLSATKVFCTRTGRPPDSLDELRSSDARFAMQLSKEKLSVLRGGLTFTPAFLALKGAMPDAYILVAAESSGSEDGSVYVICADGHTRTFSSLELRRQIGLLQERLKEMKPTTRASVNRAGETERR